MLSFFVVTVIFTNETLGKSVKEDFLYNIQWGNVTVGKAIVNLTLENNKIVVEAKTKTEGVTDTFYQYKSEFFSYNHLHLKLLGILKSLIYHCYSF